MLSVDWVVLAVNMPGFPVHIWDKDEAERFDTPESINGVVYKNPCMDCPRAYVGQTGRPLSIRLKEHKRAVQNGDMHMTLLQYCA